MCTKQETNNDHLRLKEENLSFIGSPTSEGGEP